MSDDDRPSRWAFPRASRIRSAILVLSFAAILFTGWFVMIRMPGSSYSGPLPALTDQEVAFAESLRRDVTRLGGEIGERNVTAYPKQLAEAADFVERSLADAGYEVRSQRYSVGRTECRNLEVEIRGASAPDEIVVVGAHYDSVVGAPGANDNGSGTAAVLALARSFAGSRPARTLRFVAFTNEEPPHFQTEEMGSLVYARACRQRGDRVVAMLSLETIGYYTDEPSSQKYPFPLSLFYPSKGDFIGFVANVSSRDLLHDVIGSFRRDTRFPSEGAAVPDAIPGVGWSDHWSFWQAGYPAVQVTDTAPFRYPYYHTALDTPDRVDYDRTARVVAGLRRVVAELAGGV